ncbi:guanylate-binding protein 2-like isoform X3 [Lampetra planeri]
MASPAPATTQQLPPPLDVDELLKCGTSKPLPFIVTDEKGMFYVDPDTAKIIAAINKPLVVVSIVGKYRTGKSFFMNRLAGSNTGFSLGCATEAQTKGIWVWPRPHPDNDKYLLLLDTEGLDDIQKGDEHHDMWIFVMAVLMSTTLVWNIMGVLDHHSLEQLNFITNITEHVQTKNTQRENEQELDVHNYFPNFIVCIRDFTLDLMINQTSCTADEYMEHYLNPPKHEELRNQRNTLCTYLKNRKCFVFQRPVEEDHLKHLENVADDKLRPAFLDAAKQFKEYVLQTSTVKQINSVTLTGPSFLTLVEEYVINSNNPKFKLCIESTLTHVVNTSNKKAKDEAINNYNKNMESVKTRFPLPVQELCKLHEDCFRDAMELFNQNSVLDREKTHIKELKDKLEGKFRNWTIENNTRSREKCVMILQELYEPIKAKAVAFLKQGRIKNYYDMMKELKFKYSKTENLGDENNNVLLAFVDEKETMVEKILEKNASMHEKYKKDNEDLNSKLAQQIQKHNQQEFVIANLKEKVKSKTERAEKLKMDLHAVEETRSTSKVKLEETVDAKHKVEVELAGYKAKEPILASAKAHSEEERVKAEQKAKEAEVELAGYKAKEPILTSAKAHIEKKNEGLISEISTEKVERAKAETKLKELEMVNVEQKAKKDEERVKQEKAEAERADMLKKIENLQKKNEGLISEISTEKVERAKAETKLKELEMMNVEQKAKKDEERVKQEKAEAERADMLKKIENLQKKNEGLISEISTEKVERAKAETKLKELEMVNMEQKAKEDEEHVKQEKAEAERADMLKKIENLQVKPMLQNHIGMFCLCDNSY